MKRSEAIQILDNERKAYIIKGCKLDKAIDMAIDALSDRPTGEWICKGDYAMCSKCGGLSDTQFDGVERTPRTTAFCPHCGRRMKGAEHEID